MLVLHAFDCTRESQQVTIERSDDSRYHGGTNLPDRRNCAVVGVVTRGPTHTALSARAAENTFVSSCPYLSSAPSSSSSSFCSSFPNIFALYLLPPPRNHFVIRRDRKIRNARPARRTLARRTEDRKTRFRALPDLNLTMRHGIPGTVLSPTGKIDRSPTKRQISPLLLLPAVTRSSLALEQ